MPLHIAHRPATFDEVIGNENTIAKLKSVLGREDKPKSYLLTGPTGTGKTTLARIIANVLKCSKYDLKEIDAGAERGVATSDEIRATMRLAPMEGNIRVYIIDEVHAVSSAFQKSLLKILEDTPSHVYFILCTTDPQKLLPTIRNRCSQFETRSLSKVETLKLLKDVAGKETVDIPDPALREICLASEGCPRQALVLLDQIIGLPEEEMAKAIRFTIFEEKKITDLYNALVKPKVGWMTIAKILKGIDADPEEVRRSILGLSNYNLLREDDPRLALILECFREPFYNIGKPGLTLACYNVVAMP